MKLETLQKRLIKVINDNGLHNTKSVQLLKEFAEMPKKNGEQYDSSLVHDNIIRAYKIRRNFRFVNQDDYRKPLEKLFKLLKLNYELKNDAPRGGKEGYYYQINTKIIR